MFIDYLRAAAVEFGLVMTAEQLKQFELYYELLIAWNEKMNLTTLTAPQDVAVKHIIDSLSCHTASLFPAGCLVADIGTGAGFPGLPLRIMYPEIRLALVDSLNKRLIFLAEVLQALDITDVQLHHARAEDFGHMPEQRGRYDIVVSRAVAPLNVLCELCLPLVKPGGHFLAMKGAKFAIEAEEAKGAMDLLGGRLSELREVTLPGVSDSRAVLDILKERPCPAKYPRKPGLPGKKPLC